MHTQYTHAHSTNMHTHTPPHTSTSHSSILRVATVVHTHWVMATLQQGALTSSTPQFIQKNGPQTIAKHTSAHRYRTCNKQSLLLCTQYGDIPIQTYIHRRFAQSPKGAVILSHLVAYTNHVCKLCVYMSNAHARDTIGFLQEWCLN